MVRDVAQLLSQAHSLGVDRLDAQLLLAHRLGRTRTWLMAHAEAVVADPIAAIFEADCRSRTDDCPLAYLVGEREFYGLMFKVTPAVLVPRPDTETLVDWAAECVQTMPAATPRLLDLGTGTGAIALSVLQAVGQRLAHMTATDVSAAALEVAAANAERLTMALEFQLGSWWHAVAGRRFDLVVSNPPYIAEGDAHLPALRHEPQLALTSGADGLTALRQIVAGAPQHLNPGAWLLLEHGADQAAAVRDLLLQRGFEAIQTRRDMGQRERSSGGQWPGRDL